MHTIPYTEKPQDDLAPDATAPLPLRKEVPNFPVCDPPQKEMSKTTGGKITDFFIYKVLGFGVNSAASVGVTYFFMSKKGVKGVIEGITTGAQKIFKNVAPERIVGRVVEIGFMLVSGTVITAVMAPLVKKREDMAYWINKKLGKDTDVLPEQLKTYDTPVTLEDKIEQDLKKRVKYGQTSRDLWKARWSGILVPLVGDGMLADWNTKREAAIPAKWSTDSISWQAGQKLYDDILPPKKIKWLGKFFSSHGAGIEDMRKPNKEGKIPDTYKLLEKSELKHSGGEQINHDRMMIADQTRLLGKEVGWTLVLAEIVEKLTCKYQTRRIRREEDKALAKMREEGIIPVGVQVDTDKQGHVKLTTTKKYVPYAPTESAPDAGITVPEAAVDSKKWTGEEKVKKMFSDAAEKSASHLSATEKSRAIATTQPAL